MVRWHDRPVSGQQRWRAVAAGDGRLVTRRSPLNRKTRVRGSASGPPRARYCWLGICGCELAYTCSLTTLASPTVCLAPMCLHSLPPSSASIAPIWPRLCRDRFSLGVSCPVARQICPSSGRLRHVITGRRYPFACYHSWLGERKRLAIIDYF